MPYLMQHRGGSRVVGEKRRESLDDNLAALQQQDEMLSDDDNAAPDIQPDSEEKEDPLILAMEDLEGRVVNSLDDVKMHPGVRSSDGPTVHDELATLLRPVIEVAAHTGPSVARTYYSPLGVAGEGIEASCQDVYERLVSDLVLPVMLEMAQSDTIPAKRVASLEFFHGFWKEIQKAGSWLDNTSTGPSAGPYGSGGGGHSSIVNTPAMRAQEARRKAKRLAREGEILRYWVQASIACTLPGAFTSSMAEDSVASRGVIAASASLRPSLRHLAQRIEDADDRGANRVYGPVMKMVEGVMKKLFVKGADTGESLRSACIKFLEIVVLCCSSKGQEQGDKRKRVHSNTTEDFALEDLPPGHPIITREALESIAEYAFTALRGFVLMGGQVKIDENFMSQESSGSPSSQVVSILKPAALAFLALESSVSIGEQEIEFNVDRLNIDMEFSLGHKSYALTINAVSLLAAYRPMFYKEAATCLARRAVDPPPGSAVLGKAASLAISAHLRASCLTLLRNALSVSTHGHVILHKALSKLDMSMQADKALKMATQTAALKTAGRAARNRAAMFYEWDDSEDKRTNKRQRETDDALAKMRAAKAAKGLGNGIQLPASMVDCVELILLNLSHLPSKRPSGGAAKNRKRPMTFDYVVDAVMTNGASLSEEDGQWYERDGGSAWTVDLSIDRKYQLEGKTLLAGEIEHDKDKASQLDANSAENMPKVFQRQCQTAASQAMSRIVHTSSHARDQGMAEFGSKIAARLSWTLKYVTPTSDLKDANLMASESVIQLSTKMELLESEGQALSTFVNTFPLVSACLSLDVTDTFRAKNGGPSSTASSALVSSVLNVGYMASCKMGVDNDPADTTFYKDALDVFVASTVHASYRANEKPNDNERKHAAAHGATTLSHQLSVLPALTPSSLRLLCGLCDTDEITRKASESSRKTSQQSIAASAAIHAAKVAAEKRATAALIALRDVAFQRTKASIRKVAVECAVGVAGGRYPASPSVEDKALKLVINVLFPKSDILAAMVLEAAKNELSNAAQYAIDNHDAIRQANTEAEEAGKRNPLGPASDIEKAAMEHVKKPTVLFMALCVRRPDMIKTLMSTSCQQNAGVLSKAVRANMPKLARAVATKHGAATIALEVASMADQNEIPMVLAFLENLTLDKSLPPEELVEACHKIQESKLTQEGKKDPRFIIPVVASMKRFHLVEKLPEFMAADDNIFMAALVRMGDRVTRQALLFRDEPDHEIPILTGMTLCEQLVFLHRMDFIAVGIPQKRYLTAIRNCLEDDTVFTDRVVMAAMDYISGVFLSEKVELPLAYMRTIMLVCSKHESLHSWICHVLLPRLVEGEVYQDRRQWEGWMRCARMLEKPGESGVSSRDAIRQLPQEQLQIYRAKYPNE